MPQITVLVGLPASGKTSFRLRLAAKTPDLAVISSDDRIEAIAMRDGISYHDAYVAHSDRIGEAILADAAAHLAAGRDLVWDQTNLDAAARARILDMAPAA